MPSPRLTLWSPFIIIPFQVSTSHFKRHGGAGDSPCSLPPTRHFDHTVPTYDTSVTQSVFSRWYTRVCLYVALVASSGHAGLLFCLKWYKHEGTTIRTRLSCLCYSVSPQMRECGRATSDRAHRPTLALSNCMMFRPSSGREKSLGVLECARARMLCIHFPVASIMISFYKGSRKAHKFPSPHLTHKGIGSRYEGCFTIRDCSSFGLIFSCWYCPEAQPRSAQGLEATSRCGDEDFRRQL